VADIASIKYRAFLSYSHRDVGWARWLHSRLEAFRIDKDLVGRATALGPVPSTLRPIFRDREDFSGGHSLTDATLAAIDASAALIVLCSPVSASRPVVNEEVRLFRSRHPERPVIPVIIEGSAPDNFPPALRFELAADGSITDRPITILGPDLRESADGKTLGLAKTIAGLTGLAADDIFRRAERARRRQTRLWSAVAGICLVLAVAATASAIYAWQQLKTNEAFLNATLQTATEIVSTAVTQAEKYGVPRTATLALLNKAEDLFDNMARFGRLTPELQYRKAEMLIVFARNYAALGETANERAHAEEAVNLLTGLVAANPNNTAYRRGLAIASDEVGDVDVAQGNLTAALVALQSSLTIMEQLTKSDPHNTAWQSDLSASYDRIGNVHVALGNLTTALTAYQASLAIREKLAASDANNPDWQRALSVSHEEIGDVQLAQGDVTAALASYQADLAIAERLAKAEANNAERQRDLAVSYNKVGIAQDAEDDLAAALKSYQANLAISERLAQSDPANATWQSDLSVAYARVGDVQLEQSDPAAALKSYQSGVAIAQRLAQSDPGNSRWQWNLSILHENVGDVELKEKKWPDALASYRASVAIKEPLAKSDPGNTGWQRDLSVSYNKIGDAQSGQGDFPAALASYQSGLAIRGRLSKAAPGNGGWLRDLAVSYGKVGGAYLQLKQQAKAREAFAAGQGIIARLNGQHPDWPQLQKDLAWFNKQIAELKD
jgi:tetratricopeptide (TPR) repeat protein